MDVWVVTASSVDKKSKVICRSRLDAMLKIASLGQIRTTIATSERIEGTAVKNGSLSVWAIRKTRAQKVQAA